MCELFVVDLPVRCSCVRRGRARARTETRRDYRRPSCHILQRAAHPHRTVGLQRVQPAVLQRVLRARYLRSTVRVQELCDLCGLDRREKKDQANRGSRTDFYTDNVYSSN